MKNTRNILLFMHLPKTGGMTFRISMSTRIHGRHYVDLPYINRKETNLADIQHIIKNNPDIYAIGGHKIFIHQKDLVSEHIRFFPVFFVRSWFDWIVSHYYFMRRGSLNEIKSEKDMALIVIRTASLNEYLELVSDRYIPTVCSRYFLPGLRELRDRQHNAPPRLNMSGNSDKHRKREQRTLIKDEQFMLHMRMCHIGVTERYDESLVVMEHELAPHFPGIDLSYESPMNTNTSKMTHTSPYEAERKSADSDVLQSLERRLADAIWLHDFANTELDRKISGIPNFEERLEHFRFRCGIKPQATHNEEQS